jgi:hypothetical protein
MQVTIDFSQVSVPTPELYANSTPDKQRENLAYVALQLCAQAKQQGVKLTYTDNDDPPTVGLRLDGAEQATKDLAWNSQTIDLGPFKIHLHNRAISVEMGM